MTDNAQKIPASFSLHQFAGGKVKEIVQQLGKSYPCHIAGIQQSGIVTVQFDVTGVWNFPQVMQMPVAMPQYVRYPLQVGDKGVAMSADAYLGGVTGLGAGTANAAQRQSNLGALFFVPLANKSWAATDTGTTTIIGGPNGVVIQDSTDVTTIKVTANTVTIRVPIGKTIIVSSGGVAQPVKLADNTNSIVLMAQ